MTKNKFIKAFRLKSIIQSSMLNLNRKLRATNQNSEVIKIVQRFDTLQKRLEITDKYLKI
jgi:hypothetical protein